MYTYYTINGIDILYREEYNILGTLETCWPREANKVSRVYNRAVYIQVYTNMAKICIIPNPVDIYIVSTYTLCNYRL